MTPDYDMLLTEFHADLTAAGVVLTPLQAQSLIQVLAREEDLMEGLTELVELTAADAEEEELTKLTPAELQQRIDDLTDEIASDGD